MSAEVIVLPIVHIERNSDGNGAREALSDIETLSTGGLCWADFILAELWIRGFKVVPLEPSDG